MFTQGLPLASYPSCQDRSLRPIVFNFSKKVMDALAKLPITAEVELKLYEGHAWFDWEYVEIQAINGKIMKLVAPKDTLFSSWTLAKMCELIVARFPDLIAPPGTRIEEQSASAFDSLSGAAVCSSPSSVMGDFSDLDDLQAFLELPLQSDPIPAALPRQVAGGESPAAGSTRPPSAVPSNAGSEPRGTPVLGFVKEKGKQAIGTGVKSLKCPDCDKIFNSQGALRRHKKIHSTKGEKFCLYCSKQFIRADKMNEHLFYHVPSLDLTTKDVGFTTRASGKVYHIVGVTQFSPLIRSLAKYSTQNGQARGRSPLFQREDGLA